MCISGYVLIDVLSFEPEKHSPDIIIIIIFNHKQLADFILSVTFQLLTRARASFISLLKNIIFTAWFISLEFYSAVISWSVKDLGWIL